MRIFLFHLYNNFFTHKLFKKIQTFPFLSLLDNIGFLIGHLISLFYLSSPKFFHLIYLVICTCITDRTFHLSIKTTQIPGIYNEKSEFFEIIIEYIYKIFRFFSKSTATSKIFPFITALS